MKKFIILMCLLVLGKAGVAADIEPSKTVENVPSEIVLTGNLVFDWLDITQVERDAVIDKYKSELFDENTVYKYKKKDFRAEYKDFLKDKDYKRHYMLVRNGVRYIDKFSENYPNFPYMSKQYRANGSLVSAIYFISHDMQYMYEEDQKFKGAWYKDKMYDRHAKQVLTRTNW